MVGIPSGCESANRSPSPTAEEDIEAHARYATVSEGSLLKCSDSMKRAKRFQLMEGGH